MHPSVLITFLSNGRSVLHNLSSLPLGVAGQQGFKTGNITLLHLSCVDMIRLFRKISYISLDYDIGEGKTGYDVLVYMKENDIVVDHINIYSDLSVGVPKMKEYVWNHFPGVSLTDNPLNFK